MTGPQRIVSRSAEIGGGISVNRLLPTRLRRNVGAWCFLDHAGPATFIAGGGLRVGPHPHIGLQTFTWMLDGEVLHRDSLGNVQVIRPGQVNLMTAGHGISHTEETLDDERALHAAQLWIALPADQTDCSPAFEHYPTLPAWEAQGCRFTLLAGTYDTHCAPTTVYTPLLGIDIHSAGGGRVTLALDPAFEYGILPLEGEITVCDAHFGVNELAYLAPGQTTLSLELAAGTRILFLGGAPFEHEIVMWWNFVGLSREQVIRAQNDWERADARFGKVEGFDGAPLTAPPLPWPQP